MVRQGDELAPIVLFVYNRPDHTRLTLKALSLNTLARDSTLYVYCDGAKNEADMEMVLLTRSIVKSEQWCGSVVVMEAPANLGLAQSIVKGVTEVLRGHESVIVLEDDIVTSKGFLKYMNDALVVYRDNSKVMHVSGYMYPIGNEFRDGIVFLRVLSCWGWATWRRAWTNYRDDTAQFMQRLRSNKLRTRFNVLGSATFYDQLAANHNGTMRTWAVKWFASWFFLDGYSVFPRTTLVRNIGHDGSGENSAISNVYTPNVVADYINVGKMNLVDESIEYLRAIDRFYRSLGKAKPKPTMSQKVVGYITRIIKNVATKCL